MRARPFSVPAQSCRRRKDIHQTHLTLPRARPYRPLIPRTSVDVYLPWHGKARTLGQFVLKRQATASDRPTTGQDLRQFVRPGRGDRQIRTKCPRGARSLGQVGSMACPNAPTPVLLLPLHADRADSGCIGLHTRVTSLKRPPLETGPDCDRDNLSVWGRERNTTGTHCLP